VLAGYAVRSLRETPGSFEARETGLYLTK